MDYDLVITEAHANDPASGMNRGTSIAIKDGLFATVGDQIDASKTMRVIDASGHYLSPVWFDMHVHVRNLAFSDLDTIGVLQHLTSAQ
jgi:predicted amidohydrolase